VSPSKLKFPLKILGRRCCAVGFNSGVKGLNQLISFICGETINSHQSNTYKKCYTVGKFRKNKIILGYLEVC
jgi:hypothetical protein